VTREHDAVRGLLAPVAVCAATAAEIARVEAHAQECPVCREDLAHLREGADVLALSVPPAEPSPRLKRDLMATVRSEAALRAPARAPARRPRRDWAATLRSWPAAALAAAAVALVMIGWNVALQTGEPGPGPSPEVTSLAVSGPGGIEGRVLYLPDEDRAFVNVSRLPQPGDGKGYELWVIRDGQQPASAGFMQVSGPADSVAVASGVRGADALAITLEPLTNRAGPTTDPVVAVELPQRA
jgi:anti-sigma-K factor RskA